MWLLDPQAADTSSWKTVDFNIWMITIRQKIKLDYGTPPISRTRCSYLWKLMLVWQSFVLCLRDNYKWTCCSWRWHHVFWFCEQIIINLRTSEKWNIKAVNHVRLSALVTPILFISCLMELVSIQWGHYGWSEARLIRHTELKTDSLVSRTIETSENSWTLATFC